MNNFINSFKSKIIFNLFLVFLIISLYSCSKEDVVSTDSQEISEQEWNTVEQSLNQVSLTADSILTTIDPSASWQEKLPFYKSLPFIEDAKVENNSLCIKIKKGGNIFWSPSRETYTPPKLNLPNIKGNFLNSVNSNSKILLINQAFNDEDRISNRDIINRLSDLFSSLGFQVTVKNGSQANINLFKNELKNYFLIYDISHGQYFNDLTWLVTGEEVSLFKNIKNFYNDWLQNRISIFNVDERRNGKKVTVKYYDFSENLIANSYEQNSFENSLLYFGACESFKSPNRNLASTFVSKGAKVVLGWDESNCIGPSAGELLLTLMCGGMSLHTAYNALPTEMKTQQIDITKPSCNSGITSSTLRYYPTNASDYKIVSNSESQLTISSPINGNTYSSRVVSLAGFLNNANILSWGKADVYMLGQQGLYLNLITNGSNFSQRVLLRKGTNYIKIVCSGLNSANFPISGSKSISVNANLPSLKIGTELRWNKDFNDLDFHLLPPNYGLNFLWTTTDCYYNNKTPNWGAVLDVDDVDGYGPEHITMQNYQINGDYRLFVHYYATHNVIDPTEAFVGVYTLEGDWTNFGPITVENAGGNNLGDLWEICKINLPSGTITPVNRKYNLGDILINTSIPTKGK